MGTLHEQEPATVAEVRSVWLAVANRAPGQGERFDRMLDSVRTEARRVPELEAARAETALAAVLRLHHRDDDGDCPECGVDAYGEPIPWPCVTARTIDAAMRAGSVDTHTDTPGRDT